ncbi:MAG TPA: flagellar filament capping protein FliD [Kofleriaceae bacterium]|nr:flagellar filament capping protein FliD [Kofleriaceae bacterium]
MPVINFNGLATGLDTGSMIDQLVAAEKQKETVYQQRISDLGSQGQILDDLTSRLTNLRDKALALDTATELQDAKVATSDSTHATVAIAGASIGSHTLRVDSLARAQTVTSIAFAGSGAGAAGTGSVDIKTGTSTVNVAWTASDSLADIAQRVNDANSGITAAVVFDGTNYRLVANAKATGTAAASTFVENGNGLGWSVAANIKTPATDASFELDGVPMTRGSNLVDDALPGATFTLKGVHAAGEADTTIDITADRDALRTKMKGLVDAYNSVAGALDNQLRYDGTTKGTNTLFGDSTLRGLQGQLTRIITDRHGDYSLADLGASIGKDGTLTFDATKFDSMVISNPNAVQGLLVTGGLSTALSDLCETQVRAGDGVLVTKGDALDSRTKDYQKDIDSIEDAATKMGDRLREQFNALEQAVSNMKAQSSQLTAILG